MALDMQEALYDKQDGIATVTFNRPENLNNFSDPMLRSVATALHDARTDPDVRVIVMTGAGRAFSAGGDIKSMQRRLETETPIDRRDYLRRGVHPVAHELIRNEKPVIAAINGDAIGAGCDMALHCDLRIAVDTARFGETYIKLGLIPGNGAMWLLPRAVGLPKAYELLFTGDIISAPEAEHIGLINYAVPKDEFESRVNDLASKLAAAPPVAMQIIKQGVRRGQMLDLAGALDYASLAMGIAMSTEDHAEGVRAFIEKRKPVFRGR